MLNHCAELFTTTGLLMLLAPAPAFLFAVAFVISWYRWKRRFLIWLAIASVMFAAGVLSQTLGVPGEIHTNLMSSSVMYAAAVIALGNGALKRMGLKLRYRARLSMAALVLAGIAYFSFMHPSVKTTLYVANLGFGALNVIDATYLGRASQMTRKFTDRMMYWLMLGLGLQAVPRVLLSVGSVGESTNLAAFTQTQYWFWVNATYALLVVLIGGTMLAALAFELMDEFHGRAMIDPLTGLLNQRGFEKSAQKRVAKAKDKHFSVAVCDVDSFKVIRDSHGDAQSDEVLTGIAELLRKNLRLTDEAARLNGEQFVMLISDIDREDAFALIDRLRKVIEGARFGGGELRQRRITASFGVAEYRGDEDLKDVIERAGAMLYAAKRSGRNRAVVDWLGVELQIPMLGDAMG